MIYIGLGSSETRGEDWQDHTSISPNASEHFTIGADQMSCSGLSKSFSGPYRQATANLDER